jgi:hypothetical protein
MTRLHWSVSLSDGTNAQEGAGDYQNINGDKSPWQRLVAFALTNGLTITALSLRHGDLAWNLPSAGKSPKFRAFQDIPRPDGFRFFRRAGIDIDPRGGGQVQERFAVAEARYGGYAVQVWVDQATLASWTLVVPDSL